MAKEAKSGGGCLVEKKKAGDGGEEKDKKSSVNLWLGFTSVGQEDNPVPVCVCYAQRCWQTRPLNCVNCARNSDLKGLSLEKLIYTNP